MRAKEQMNFEKRKLTKLSVNDSNWKKVTGKKREMINELK